ncbi:PAS domain-containing protein [Thermodesulfobacteriota bacterium]
MKHSYEELEYRIKLLEREAKWRAQAEEALRNSEEHLKILFEYAPDAYYLNDLQGFFIDGNKAAEEMIGYSRGQLIGKNFMQLALLPPEDLPKAQNLLAANALGQPSGPDDFTLIRKDGSRLVAEIRTYPVKIKGKSLVLGIARDVTARKQAEEALRKAHEGLDRLVEERTAELIKTNEQLIREIEERRRAEKALKESKRRYKEFADSLPQVVFETDETGRFTFANRNAFDLFDYTRNDFDEGLNALQMLMPEDREKALKNIQRVLNGEEFGGVEYTALKKDGSTFPILVHANRILLDGKPVGMRGIVIDRTDSK